MARTALDGGDFKLRLGMPGGRGLTLGVEGGRIVFDLDLEAELAASTLAGAERSLAASIVLGIRFAVDHGEIADQGMMRAVASVLMSNEALRLTSLQSREIRSFTTYGLLYAFAYDASIPVREALALHPEAPEASLLVLATDPCFSVRRRVALAPAATPAVLGALASGRLDGPEDMSVLIATMERAETQSRSDLRQWLLVIDRNSAAWAWAVRWFEMRRESTGPCCWLLRRMQVEVAKAQSSEPGGDRCGGVSSIAARLLADSGVDEAWQVKP